MPSPLTKLWRKAAKPIRRLRQASQFDRNPYYGIIVRESLADQGIVKCLNIEKQKHDDGWLVYLIATPQPHLDGEIVQLQSAMAAGPWYAHYWRGGELIVVFKHRVFRGGFTNKRLWADAVAYGRSQGIAEEQLDFHVSPEETMRYFG